MYVTTESCLFQISSAGEQHEHNFNSGRCTVAGNTASPNDAQSIKSVSK